MAAHFCLIDIPPEIASSPLFDSGGFVLIPSLFTAEVLADLEAEALSVRSTGQRNELVVSDAAEGRGGSPARAFTSAHSRTLQWQIFASPALIASVSQMCGLPIVPTGGGSYTYYEQPGDFLALHRDIVRCDLALITCLSESGTGVGSGGLLVYPGHTMEPLSKTREAGRAAATPVPLARGDTVALLGGIVPHEVTPMQPGQERIVSVMCYRTSSGP